MIRVALALAVFAAALTAALGAAFAGGSGGSRSEADAPPVTTLTAGPTGPTNVTSASFMFTADQSDAHFSCALDSPTFGQCESPANYSALGDGQHTFYVYAVRDGHQGPTASWSWTIDTVSPAPVTGLHAGVGYGTLRLSWTRWPDTDHVVIFRSVGSEETAKQVYAGSGPAYVERKYVNALEHRYNFVSYDKAGNVSPPTGIDVESSALILAPANGAVVRGGHRVAFRWRAVRRASFYNVQLWRGKRKVLSAWPHRPAFLLSRGWSYKNRGYHLEPGIYTWFVWPALGRNGAYGKLVGTATFRVS